MEDFHLMQGLEAANYLNEYFPDLILRNVLLLLLVLGDLLKQVSIVRVFHYNAIVVISQCFHLP